MDVIYEVLSLSFQSNFWRGLKNRVQHVENALVVMPKSGLFLRSISSANVRKKISQTCIECIETDLMRFSDRKFICFFTNYTCLYQQQ